MSWYPCSTCSEVSTSRSTAELVLLFRGSSRQTSSMHFKRKSFPRSCSNPPRKASCACAPNPTLFASHLLPTAQQTACFQSDCMMALYLISSERYMSCWLLSMARAATSFAPSLMIASRMVLTLLSPA